MDLLGKAYKTVNTILTSDDDLTFESCVTRLKEEEASQKDKTKVVIADAALAAYNGNDDSNHNSNHNRKPAAVSNPDNCLKCGKRGH